MTVTQRIQDKKWIKPGAFVAHRDFPSRKMVAEEVIKQSKDMLIDGRMQKKVLTVGVWCHWFDETGRYDRGRFLTMELFPFGRPELIKEFNEPAAGSFSPEIPESNEIPENKLDDND